LEARHNLRIQQAQVKAAASREDAGKAHVILNEKRNKKSVKCDALFVMWQHFETDASLQIHGR
jgi:hypothetical protein